MSVDSSVQGLTRLRKLSNNLYEFSLSHHIDEILQQVLQTAISLTGAGNALILSVDENVPFFSVLAIYRKKRTRPRAELTVSEQSIAGWTVKHKKPISVADVHGDRRYSDSVEKAIAEKVTNMLAVPLLTKQSVNGVLEVVNKQGEGFTNEDQETLLLLAAQTALILENANMLQQSTLIQELMHELRTPLTSLSAIAYILQQPELDPKQHQTLVDTIQTEIQRLVNLTTDYLDISRLNSGKVRFSISAFNLVEVSRECCQFVQSKVEAAELTLSFICHEKSLEIEADSQRIKQVILNLLNNAINYNHPNGKINFRLWVEQGFAYIQIRDTGIGIPREEIPLIFNRFFRTGQARKKVVGSGLGLPISKRIVDEHHGTIEVISKQGCGSIFKVKLPLQFISVKS